MDKETLFKAILNREVVLWAGSGFSRYAGFPMGGGFLRHLYDSLSSAQQQLAHQTFPYRDADGYPGVGLPAFATFYTNLFHGKNQALRKELKKVFTARPKSLKTHQEVASNTFFEHIVTTNYDTLFEQAYGSDRLHVITAGTDLPYQEKQKTNLYKIHGTIESPDSILITEEDYRRFYSKADPLLWGAIETLLTSHTVLFVGYGFEDQNVVTLFEQILDALGTNMPGAYLVAPSMPEARLDWLKRRGITYIAATGEQLMEELLQYLKDQAIPALRRGTDLTSTTNFLRNLGLKPTIKAGPEGYEVAALEGIDGAAPIQLNFRVTESGHNSMSRFQEGFAGRALKLDPSQLLHCEYRVAGVNLGLEVESMMIVRSPVQRKTVDIEFAGGLYIQDATLSVYSSKKGLDIYVYNDLHQLEINILRKELDFEGGGLQCRMTVGQRHKYIDSVESGLQHARIMQSLGRGEAISIFENGELIWSSPQQEPMEELLQQADAWERSMLALQVIERGFSIRFRRFIFSRQDAEFARQISQILQMKSFVKENFTGHLDVEIDPTFVIPPDLIEMELIFERHVEVTYEIMGWEFNLVYDVKHILDRPVLKKRPRRKHTYRITSENRRMNTVYGPEQTVKVVKHGKPEPPQKPALIDFNVNDSITPKA